MYYDFISKTLCTPTSDPKSITLSKSGSAECLTLFLSSKTTNGWTTYVIASTAIVNNSFTHFTLHFKKKRVFPGILPVYLTLKIKLASVPLVMMIGGFFQNLHQKSIFSKFPKFKGKLFWHENSSSVNYDITI